jgi:hypothetical protein
MEIVKNYLPATIKFTATTNEVPESLGTFENAEDVQKFMSENFIAMPKQIETFRLLDEYEKEHIRNEYITELEENYPQYHNQLIERAAETQSAKESEKRASETVSASFNKIEALSKEVKKGIAEINLDPATTYEVALNGNYYYYTWINAELKLAKVRKIPDHEVSDLFNSSERNKTYFEELKNLKKAAKK